MNQHLFTHWKTKGVVECTCGWSRRAKSAPAAARKHAKHVTRLKGKEFLTTLKIPRTPFIAVAGEIPS